MLAREKKRTAILAANTTDCPVCGKCIHEAVFCRKMGKNVCAAHCSKCKYNVEASAASNQSCLYK